jgi:hypothetical protein
MVAMVTFPWASPHFGVVLSPINREFRPIVVPPDQAHDFKIVAEFIAVLGR